MARLADAVEALLAREHRRELEERDQELRRVYGARIGRLDIRLLLRSVPQLADLFKRTVPPDMVAQVDDGEYEIACPCGGQPSVAHGGLAECKCGRWFLHDGQIVHVALTPSGDA